MASRDKADMDTSHKCIQYALEKLGKSKSGFEGTVVSKFKSKSRVGSGNKLVDPELRALVLTKRHVGSGNEIAARAEIPFPLQETFSDFQARLAGLEILARFEHTGLGFSARAELRPGLNPSPCNRQFGFQRICFRSRSEISARDEIPHVIRP